MQPINKMCNVVAQSKMTPRYYKEVGQVLSLVSDASLLCHHTSEFEDLQNTGIYVMNDRPPPPLPNRGNDGTK